LGVYEPYGSWAHEWVEMRSMLQWVGTSG
jgi:hypothetical protein